MVEEKGKNKQDYNDIIKHSDIRRGIVCVILSFRHTGQGLVA